MSELFRSIAAEQLVAWVFRELDERGLFNPESAEDRRRREVEAFFRRAEAELSLIKPLADLLNRYRLFEEYQDRFFQLVRRGQP